MIRLLTFIALNFIVVQMFATNYYCDPVNGNMGNVGTLNAPWSSVQAVFDNGKTFNGGDKIFLMDGNHSFPKIVGDNSSNVEILPLLGHSPVIEKIRFGNMASASKWVLNGVLIKSENTVQYAGNLVDLYPNCSNITIVNCTITSNLSTSNWTRNDWRNKTNNGIFAKGTGHKFNYNTIKNVAIGLTMLSDFSQFIGNTIQYFTIDGIRGLGSDCLYANNVIKDNVSVYYYAENHYDGFQSYSCCPVGSGTVSNVIIRGNKFINTTDFNRNFNCPMRGIGCFDGMYNNWVIENNVIIVDHYHGITLSGATNCTIRNNTIIDPYDVTPQDPNEPNQWNNPGPAWIRITAHKTDGGVFDGTPSTNNTIINNLVSVMNNDNGIGLMSNNILMGNSFNYSNYFADVSAFDLHLTATSTVVDAGTNVNAPPVDFDNISRPQGAFVDVGAFEYIDNQNTEIEEGEMTGLVIYPNPASHYIFIENNKEAKFRSFLYDGEGRLVLSEQVNQLDVSKVARGVYILKIETNDIVYNKRIVIQ